MTTYTQLSDSSYLSSGETLAGTSGGSNVGVAVSGSRGSQGYPGYGFWLGDGNAGPIGNRNETVTTTFSRPVDSVQVRVEAIHGDGWGQGEAVRFHINGQVYNLTSANLSGAGPNIALNTNGWATTQGYIINTGPNGSTGGITVTITIPGGINSLGIEYYERGLNGSGSGVTATVAVDTDPATVVVCFASGTMIETRRGEIAVEDLAIGDEVLTLDHGYQELLWIGSFEANGSEQHRPIQIDAGAFGPGLPHSDLLVSPQHRIMLNLESAKAEFGSSEILVPAKKIQMMPGVAPAAKTDEPFTYFHLVFQRHEVIMSNGLPTESFYCGKQTNDLLGPDSIAEIQKVRPEFGLANYVETPARPIVERKQQIEFLLEAELLTMKTDLNLATYLEAVAQ